MKKTQYWDDNKRFVLVLLVVLLNTLMISVTAQEQIMKGVVTDESENPLPGVSITIEGRKTGTITGTDGRYSIQVNKNDVIIYSFIGYETLKIRTIGKTNGNVQLKPNTYDLDEVVVVGYGVQKKSHFSGAVTGINVENENIADIPVESIDKALQGKLSGVQILDSEGQVGASPEIRIRGVASFSASNEPLIVIDGLPTFGSLSDVPANDIANIEILKDAASTAIYGSRGANGVVLITTKSGSNEKVSFNIKVNTGFSKIIRYFETIEIEDYARYFWLRDVLAPYETAYLRDGLEVASGINEDGTYNSYKGKTYMPFEKYFSTELNPEKMTVYNAFGAGFAQLNSYNKLVNAPTPQEAIIQDANTFSASLSASGGNNVTNYYVSMDYTNQKGIMINNYIQRLNFTARLSSNLTKKLRLELSVRPQFSTTEMSANTQFAGALRWLTIPLVHDEITLRMAKKYTGEGGAVYDWMGPGDYVRNRDFSQMWLLNDDFSDYVLDSNGNRITVRTYSASAAVTSYAQAMESSDLYTRFRLLGNIALNWDISKGLVFRTTIGGVVSYSGREYWAGSLMNSAGVSNTGYGSAIYSNGYYVNLVNENTLSYSKKVGSHQFDLLGGLSMENSTNKTLQAGGRFFDSDVVRTLNYAGEIESTRVTNNNVEVALISCFGRLNYNFKDKYLLSTLIRTDGSSQFGPDNRWGAFPSVSAAWRVTEEPFMRSVSNIVNDLKLRASYGLSGNNRISSYAYVSGVNKVDYVFDGTVTSGNAVTGPTMGNSLIGWEETLSTNIGLSASLFRSRININIDGYVNNTKSLLLQNPIVMFSGFSQEWDNIGQIEGKGVEIELNTVNVKSRNFLWTSSLNFTRSRNVLVNYGGADEQLFAGYQESLYRLKIGRPIGEYYGYKTTGEVWKTDDEIKAGIESGMAFENTIKGSLKYKDVNNDGKITDDDRTALGDPYSDFEWGMTNTFKFARIDLSFSFQGSHGAEVWNLCNILGANYLKWMNEDMYIDEFHGNRPNLLTNSQFSNSDYFVEDASYIALRDLTIGYSVPKTKLRIYFSGRNLLYLMADGYRGINPEYMAKTVSGISLIQGEQRYRTTPAMRTFSLGLNYKF